MRNPMPALCLIVASAACAPAPAPDTGLRDVVTQNDILANRPNTDILDARFRLAEDGRGTVEFLGGTSGPQDVVWTLERDVLCITHGTGLIASFGCARVIVDEPHVILAHTQSDSQVSGMLAPRTQTLP